MGDFINALHDFMKVTYQEGDTNVFSHLYPHVKFCTKTIFDYSQGYDNSKCAFVTKCRVRYGHNGAGFTGFGKTAEEAMQSIIEQMNLRMMKRSLRLEEERLEKKYLDLFKGELCIVLVRRRKGISYTSTTPSPYLTGSFYSAFPICGVISMLRMFWLPSLFP